MQQKQAPQQGNVMGMKKKQQQPQQQPNPMMQARGSSISNKVLNQALKFHLGCCCNFIFHHFRRRKFPDATAASSTRICDGHAAERSWHDQPGGPMQMGQAQFTPNLPSCSCALRVVDVCKSHLCPRTDVRRDTDMEPG